MAAAVESARRFFTEAWGETPRERMRSLQRFADALERNFESLALLEALEVGRPISDAKALLALAPDTLRRYAAMVDRIQGDLITQAPNCRGTSLS